MACLLQKSLEWTEQGCTEVHRGVGATGPCLTAAPTHCPHFGREWENPSPGSHLGSFAGFGDTQPEDLAQSWGGKRKDGLVPILSREIALLLGNNEMSLKLPF